MTATLLSEHELLCTQVTVHNELPADWPQVTEGITIHWHGLDMRGNEYYDGVAFLQQCPIASGTNFTYRFTVRQLLPVIHANQSTIRGRQQCTVQSCQEAS